MAFKKRWFLHLSSMASAGAVSVVSTRGAGEPVSTALSAAAVPPGPYDVNAVANDFADRLREALATSEGFSAEQVTTSLAPANSDYFLVMLESADVSLELTFSAEAPHSIGVHTSSTQVPDAVDPFVVREQCLAELMTLLS